MRSTSGASPTEAVRFPLSFAQQRLWFLDRLEPGGSAYNVPLPLELRGQLDTSALTRALESLLDRHEALRTTFVEEDGRPDQLIHAAGALDLELVDLSGETDPESAAKDAALSEIDAPFDLVAGPLLRVKLLRLGARRHVLVLTLHHIVADAWSLGVLGRDLSELYRAQLEERQPSLPPLDVQYGDFAVWQREWFQGQRLDSQLAYWREELAGAPPLLELPTDRPRPSIQSTDGDRVRTVFPAELADKLEAVGRSTNATLFMTLLAGYAALLARYTGARDIVVGTPIANRQRVELEPLIGFFANTVALRVQLPADPTFLEVVQQVRDRVLDAAAHQDLPFEQLVAELNPTRSLSHSPVFQTLFQLHVGAGQRPDFSGLEVERFDVHRSTSKFDLALTMSRIDDGLQASVEFATALFDRGTIERLLGHLRTLLEAAAADPHATIGSLPLLTHEEEARLRAWNETRVSFADGHRRVHELFEAQANRTPHVAAVVFRGEQLSYAELNAAANRLARHLRAAGVGRDIPVGLALERSPRLIVAVLAVLKAGGAYMPLDPTYPAERLRMMIEDSRPTLVATERDAGAFLPDTTPIVRLDEDAPRIDAYDADDLDSDGDSDSLAYVLFTSGSTGRPKGVAMPHRALTNLVLWERAAEASAARRTLQFASLSFDVASQEIFTTLTDGGTLVLVDEDTRRNAEELLALIGSEAIERLFLPFAMLQNLAEAALELDAVPTCVREVITAGEPLRSTAAVRRLFARLGGAVLRNHYGPTESHVVTAHTLEGPPASWDERPPIGRPIANARIHLLDAWGRQVPVGVPGELFIGGDVLAHGYLNRPELTGERFAVASPAGVPERLYRTGDLARYRPDGTIDYLRRADEQLKIRGHRVEPGEVEVVLGTQPGVRQACVTAREDPSGDRRLVAYLTAEPGQRPDEGELRRRLAEVLPEFMVPGAIVVLDALPVSPNGKIDRSRLPDPAAGRAEDGLVAPSTSTEQAVAAVWEEVLGVGPLGSREDFFAVGGHSLLAVRVISRLRKAFGVELPVRSLFDEPTIAGLAARLDAAVEAGTPVRGPVLEPVDRRSHRVRP
jgi:amino acid adenylation domain-containing protein